MRLKVLEVWLALNNEEKGKRRFKEWFEGGWVHSNHNVYANICNIAVASESNQRNYN